MEHAVTPTSGIIFSFFGGLWVVFAVLSQHSPKPILCLIPIGVAGLLISRLVEVARAQTAPAAGDASRRKKIAIYATVFEGAAFFVGGKILDNMAIADQYLPLLAVIVGLHFLPFARYVPDRRYYLMSLALTVIGMVGVFVPSPDIRAW